MWGEGALREPSVSLAQPLTGYRCEGTGLEQWLAQPPGGYLTGTEHHVSKGKELFKAGDGRY